MKNTSFRRWVHNMYLDNCEEHRAFQEIPYSDITVYFNTFKYWLKREFRRQNPKVDQK